MSGNESYIGRWISILYRYRQNYLGKRLEAFNIGSGEHVYLMVLSQKNGISQEGLSDFLKIDKATTAKAIKKLTEKGYVTREVDAMDKRAYQVWLTSKAWQVIPVIEDVIKDWEKLITADLPKTESALIEQLLSKMAANACQMKR